ncbi:hypothetical protein [Streptomyces sp. NBC_00212]|uniref:hypothetical protein n=1 Tax=Streptomyces sp. NBC_00212 TaxID=2975684 RepID=UPI002F917B9E
MLSAEVEDLLGGTAAAQFADEALRLARASDTPTRQAKVENLVGRVHGRRSDHERAALLHPDALELAAAIHYRAEEANALYGTTEAAEASEDTASAARHREGADALSAFMGRATASLSCRPVGTGRSRGPCCRPALRSDSCCLRVSGWRNP